MLFRKRLSEQLRADVQRYIDENYVPPQARLSGRVSAPASPPPSAAPRRAPRFPSRKAPDDFHGRAPEEDRVCEAEREEQILSAPAAFDTCDLLPTLELDEPFSVKLLQLIDQKGMDDVACYKKARVSRQTWYKILNEKGYKPNKKTVLSFAVALELTLSETQTLLESVGFVLSRSSMFDVIVMYCLKNGIYSIPEIDAILYDHDQETLYSKA